MVRVGMDSFELLTESTIEVAGRQYVPTPQRMTQNYFGVPKGSTVKPIRDSEYVLNGVKQKCRIYEVVVDKDNSRRLTRFYIAANGDPIILRQETTATDKDGQKMFEITADVVAIDMPLKVLANTIPCAYLRTVQESGDKQIITIEAYSEAVPGGVVSQSIKIRNSGGKMLERQTAELIDYGLGEMVKSTSIPLRNRVFRRRTRK